ncbi:FMN-binding negative transcriptional regulator [Streptomyces rapamycinicus]|uniref:Transcriptional regulator n=2 Tax=Streptomyces rapamycinicus TaxID=1226757 RepID=A0A0A0N676_STRRN|nr:FMN-binding negative transcriptional regulator [Streptomyces rapamycinicus]AGP51914.1 hypothetical protein M271_01385 [Streptomyces rapamycinicus NRRL 5491]MBB4779334.1 transcriptional regulator [Streptomyces rapamycinicus]RLV76003.1 hypothetical protein D3C57_142295 [Streptomyces rapamycinicus NRRL 5491]UTP28118.1 FMN-binding negative transcriptional regulator [Streptomyces rapamycinicus NRRL 5491]
MLEQELFALTDPEQLKQLIAGHGWATLITADGAAPVVSHLPVLVDEPETGSGIAVVGHLARADAETHRLGEHDAVLVVQGPHGYVSPSIYGTGPYVPTWNFVVAHLHGHPTVLGADATFDVLRRTVDHFEGTRPRPWSLDTVADYAQSIAPHTTGFRLEPTRVVGKHKLSQDKPRETVERVVAALAGDDPHRNPELADAMRKVMVARV